MITAGHGVLGTVSLVTSGFGVAAVGRAAGTALFSRGGIRALKLPSVDGVLAGSDVVGYTTENGRVFLRAGLSKAEQALTLRHESVHAFFSVGDDAFLAASRQRLGSLAYENSALLRYLEEALAEGYATGSALRGLQFPVKNGYVSITQVGAEATAISALLYSIFGD